MKEKNVKDRLSFLAESFDVFECGKENQIAEKLEVLSNDEYISTPIITPDGTIIAISSYKTNEKEMADGTIAVRKQGDGGDQGAMTPDEFAKMINDQVKEQLSNY